MTEERWINKFIFSKDEVLQIHTMPINDLKEHHTGADCWCGPRLEVEIMFIHNSLDGRERFEDLLMQ